MRTPKKNISCSAGALTTALSKGLEPLVFFLSGDVEIAAFAYKEIVNKPTKLYADALKIKQLLQKVISKSFPK